jgi:hypothetical protein
MFKENCPPMPSHHSLAIRVEIYEKMVAYIGAMGDVVIFLYRYVRGEGRQEERRGERRERGVSNCHRRVARVARESSAPSLAVHSLRQSLLPLVAAGASRGALGGESARSGARD